MGYVHTRMILDGAPASWSASMRLVAVTIADDASQFAAGPPLSFLAVEVLAERTGLTARGVSDVLTRLARSGYEMRHQLCTDSRGRPVFTTRGRRMQFRVPPLPPRREVP